MILLYKQFVLRYVSAAPCNDARCYCDVYVEYEGGVVRLYLAISKSLYSHFTTLHYTALYYTALHYTILDFTILYCTILHCTILYCTALCCTILTALYCTSTEWALCGSGTKAQRCCYVHEMLTIFFKSLRVHANHRCCS